MVRGGRRWGRQAPVGAAGMDAWRPDLAWLLDRASHGLTSLYGKPAETDGSGRQKLEETVSLMAAGSCLRE